MSAFPASWKCSFEHKISNGYRESWDEEQAMLGIGRNQMRETSDSKNVEPLLTPPCTFFSWKLPLWSLFPCPHSGPYVGRSAGAEGFARISQCLVCSRTANAEVWGAVSCSFGKQEEGVRNKEVNLLFCSTSVLVGQRTLYSLTQLRLTLVWLLR